MPKVWSEGANKHPQIIQLANLTHAAPTTHHAGGTGCGVVGWELHLGASFSYPGALAGERYRFDPLLSKLGNLCPLLNDVFLTIWFMLILKV